MRERDRKEEEEKQSQHSREKVFLNREIIKNVRNRGLLLVADYVGFVST